MADEMAWAQRLADLMNEGEAQGFPIIGFRIKDGEIEVSSYGGGVHYADAIVRRVNSRWVAEGEADG
jgi:hypothetical protein